MSEASRARYLFLRNRLEELLAKHGPPELPPQLSIECDPTWGPLGSLARAAWGEEMLQELLALDRQTRRQAVRQAPEPPPPIEDVQPPVEQQPAQNRVLEAAEAMRRLDRYGETPLFECLVCGEESAKASVPLDLWRCTSCGTSGRASSLARAEVLPSTAVHRV